MSSRPPKAGSIFPYMPPFVFASALQGCFRSLPLRRPAGAILRCKDDVSVHTQNFLLRITRQALCADIPADDAPELILSEHCEISGTFNDQSQQVGISWSCGF